jgi:hypothetical protein
MVIAVLMGRFVLMLDLLVYSGLVHGPPIEALVWAERVHHHDLCPRQAYIDQALRVVDICQP